METKPEGERLYVTIDENGMLVEASYRPMVGSRISPHPAAQDAAPRAASFQIDGRGTITGASIQNLNGRKVMIYEPSSPALGRTDTTSRSCTWKPNAEGGWVCD